MVSRMRGPGRRARQGQDDRGDGKRPPHRPATRQVDIGRFLSFLVVAHVHGLPGARALPMPTQLIIIPTGDSLSPSCRGIDFKPEVKVTDKIQMVNYT